MPVTAKNTTAAESTAAPSRTTEELTVTVTDNVTLPIHIQTVSATADLGTRLDLPTLARKLRHTHYNPRRCSALQLTLRPPTRATILIFASGKLVISQVASSQLAKQASEAVVQLLRKIGTLKSTAAATSSSVEFKVQNMVATTRVPFGIRLEGLNYAHSAFCSYEPEVFPGLIYKSRGVDVVVFVDGKLLLTGAKKASDLCTALTKLYPVLVDFKKTIHTMNPTDARDIS